MPTPRNYMKSRRRSTNWQRTEKTKMGSHGYSSFPKNSPAFKRVRNECEWRIGSYRTIYSQFTGAGTKTTFSPTNANKWLNYVNNGYRVYKWSHKDFCKYFGSQWQQGTPTACQRYLKQKYGQGIKAVTRGKANCWLIATTPTVTARPFYNYNWL